MFLTRKLAAITAVGLIGATALSGCSRVNTAPDMVAVKYKGGLIQSQSFNGCVPVSTSNFNGPGDKSYQYPANQRTYAATGQDKAEAQPIKVISKDNAELAVPVTVYFTLKTDCEKLQQFHEKLGNRDDAYWGGSEFDDKNVSSSGTPNGWLKLLGTYVGTPLDITLDRASQDENWRDLWNNPATKTKLEKEVTANLAARVDQAMGGHYFDISSIAVGKPDPTSQSLKDAVIAEQAAVAKAKAAAAEAEAEKISKVKKAEADKAEAQAQIATSKAKAAQMQEEIRVLGRDVWLKKYGIDKGVTPWPNPVVPGANTTTSK